MKICGIIDLSYKTSEDTYNKFGILNLVNKNGDLYWVHEDLLYFNYSSLEKAKAANPTAIHIPYRKSIKTDSYSIRPNNFDNSPSYTINASGSFFNTVYYPFYESDLLEGIID